VPRQNYGTAEAQQARTLGQHKNAGKREKQDMDLTITAITTDATEPVHTHLRNLPTGTVAIFAPRNTQPITLAKHVDDTWRGYAGDRPITLTASSIYSRNGSFTIVHTPEW
jgi:hypothetical protein